MVNSNIDTRPDDCLSAAIMLRTAVTNNQKSICFSVCTNFSLKNSLSPSLLTQTLALKTSIRCNQTTNNLHPVPCHNPIRPTLLVIPSPPLAAFSIHRLLHKPTPPIHLHAAKDILGVRNPPKVRRMPQIIHVNPASPSTAP